MNEQVIEQRQENSWSQIEETLGYRFRNRELLVQALTHSSYANEAFGDSSLGNERLEFLGDAVLELVSSSWLYRRLSLREGELSRIRSALVCEESLSNLALRCGFGRFLRLGKSCEKSGGRTHPPILEDLTESIFGAVFLDGGFEEARQVIERLLLSEEAMEKIRGGRIGRDYKTEYQEWMQSQPEKNFEYRVDRAEGPSHAPTFEISLWNDGVCRGRGVGHSKKAAEQLAAREALEALQREKAAEKE